MNRREWKCRTKKHYATWEAARLAGLAVWVENPKPEYMNPPTPYACDIDGVPHYHCGHYRASRVRRELQRARKALNGQREAS